MKALLLLILCALASPPAWGEVDPVATLAPDVTWIILGLQGLFGVFVIVLGFALRRVLKDIEDNTKETKAVSDALQSLNLSLVTNFVVKEDWVYIRQRVHDLGDAVGALKAREALMTDLAKSGAIRRREGE